MRSLRTVLLAGGAAAAIGISGAALAQSPNIHVMTVQLPGGGVAQIRYTGSVAPRISFDTSAAPINMFAPMPSLFGPASPFAEHDRVSAEMDRQAAAMFQQAETIANRAQTGHLTEAAIRNLPSGSQGYTFISTMSGSGVCTRSVEITSSGSGAAPRVVSHSSGNCGPSGGATGSVSLPTAALSVAQPGPVWVSAPAQRREIAPTPNARPDVVWTSAHGARPYAGLVAPIPTAQR